jgi:hypothetical protein
MRTAIGATAVNIAKPTNLSAPMTHAFLDNIRYITIELNGSTQDDTPDDVPCVEARNISRYRHRVRAASESQRDLDPQHVPSVLCRGAHRYRRSSTHAVDALLVLGPNCPGPKPQ